VETYVTCLPDPLTSPASSLFNDFGALNISQRRKVGEIETWVKMEFRSDVGIINLYFF
jgi:hypothetical protein